ncbi:hypothetical protein [Streptomyces afghaniensis]|uniref:hypothetical protein n=1 Tax=Streptomyces afghaniensis TaxID=66865 RepID=UPI002781EF38|nr:hypothetical protein [Streptomyces afghaniensis]MDQ1018410.1 hypothetical protein [Streptomyces afghaniensis]
MRALFGDRITDVRAERRTVLVDRFETPEAFRDYFKERYGPTITVYRNIAGDPERTATLDRDLADLAREGDLSTGGGGTTLEWEYLLFTARRAG